MTTDLTNKVFLVFLNYAVGINQQQDVARVAFAYLAINTFLWFTRCLMLAHPGRLRSDGFLCVALVVQSSRDTTNGEWNLSIIPFKLNRLVAAAWWCSPRCWEVHVHQRPTSVCAFHGFPLSSTTSSKKKALMEERNERANEGREREENNYELGLKITKNDNRKHRKIKIIREDERKTNGA